MSQSLLTIKVWLPGGRAETFQLPTDATVEQTRKWIFFNSPALFSVDKEKFILSFKGTKLVDSEEMFINVFPELNKLAAEKKLIEIKLVPVTGNSTVVIENFTEENKGRNRVALLEDSIVKTKGKEILSLGTVQDLLSFDNAQKEGYLFKQGARGAVKAWKKRWCVLKGNFVSYFKQKTDNKPVGSIPLQDCFWCDVDSSGTGKKNVFSIYTKFRVYLLCTEVVREMHEWIAAINRVMNEMGIERRDPKGQMLIDFSGGDQRGFLFKSGKDATIKSGLGWKKRWFVLIEGFMYYFASQKSNVPLGAIPLQDALVENYEDLIGGRKNCFSIKTRHRTYFLSADTFAIKDSWVEAIAALSKNVDSKEDVTRYIVKQHSASLLEPSYWDAMPITMFSNPECDNRIVSSVYSKAHPAVESWMKKTLHQLHDTSEVVYFRSCVAQLIAIINEDTSKKNYCEAETARGPLLESFPDSFPVFFHLPHSDFKCKSILCNKTTTLIGALKDAVSWRDKVVEKRRLSAAWNRPSFSRDSKRSSSDMFGIMRGAKQGFEEAIEFEDDPKTKLEFEEAVELEDTSKTALNESSDSGSSVEWNDAKDDNSDSLALARDTKISNEITIPGAKDDSDISMMKKYVSEKRLSKSYTQFMDNPPSPDKLTEKMNSMGSNWKTSSGTLFAFNTLMNTTNSGAKLSKNNTGDADKRTKTQNASTNEEELNLTTENSVVKLCGRAEYISHLDIPISSLSHVRETLKRNGKIEFVIAERTGSFRIISKNSPLSRLDKTQGGRMSRIGSQRKLPQFEKKEQKCISIANVDLPFQIKVLAIEGPLPHLQLQAGAAVVYVEALLAYAGRAIGTIMRTSKKRDPIFAEWLVSNILTRNLPRECKICFTICTRDAKGDNVTAWANVELFDYLGFILHGVHRIPLWTTGTGCSMGSCEPPPKTELFLNIEAYSSPLPLLHSISKSESPPAVVATQSEDEELNLKYILEKDPLQWLSDDEKARVWKHRWYINRTFPEHLAKVMLSVNWMDRTQVEEARLLLSMWPIIESTKALELLDFNFPDKYVREYALDCLRALNNRQLVSYMLQLVQVLKYETYHWSPLASFLLQRAVSNPAYVGHVFFWHLRSELDIYPSIRFHLLLEAYLYAIKNDAETLVQQDLFITQLKAVALNVKRSKESRRTVLLQEELVQIKVPRGMPLPLHPSMQVNNLIISKCKWLDSFTVPLMLVFENADSKGSPIHVIFKAGDDLRQDALTLQMLSIMDYIWKKDGLDLHLTPYTVTSTGMNMGMIEMVLEAETTAAIQKMAGGAAAVFSKQPLANWLQTNNYSQAVYDQAVRNFLRSLAGYCVATYVLGIGDRHNDNIMVTKDGHLFHIDFAHFLGNMMTFHGIKRETAPFVLTPDFVHVMGGKDSQLFKEFVSLCCQGYNLIRKYSHLFMSLFAMMLSTGMPQLNSVEDLDYLRESFCIGMTDEKAAELFTSLIFESLNTKTTQLNWAIHILAHPDI